MKELTRIVNYKVGDIITEEEYLSLKLHFGVHKVYRTFAGTYNVEVLKNGYEFIKTEEGYEIYGKKNIMLRVTSEDAKKYKTYYSKSKV